MTDTPNPIDTKFTPSLSLHPSNLDTLILGTIIGAGVDHEIVAATFGLDLELVKKLILAAAARTDVVTS